MLAGSWRPPPGGPPGPPPGGGPPGGGPGGFGLAEGVPEADPGGSPWPWIWAAVKPEYSPSASHCQISIRALAIGWQAGSRCTSQVESERAALAAFGDVRAHQVGVDVVRPFGLFGGEDAADAGRRRGRRDRRGNWTGSGTGCRRRSDARGCRRRDGRRCRRSCGRSGRCSRCGRRLAGGSRRRRGRRAATTGGEQEQWRDAGHPRSDGSAPGIRAGRSSVASYMLVLQCRVSGEPTLGMNGTRRVRQTR